MQRFGKGLLALGVTFSAVGGLAVGCPKPPHDKGEPPRPKDAIEEITRAAEVAAGQPFLVVRYNPVRCKCPQFEVQLGPRWVRLQLDGMAEPRSPAAALLARAGADLDAGKIPHYKVKGELSASTRHCAQGALYLTASVESSE